MNSEARILVIGGGPAGSACAIRLRRHGVAVDVAEKEEFPRAKVCGCCLGGAGLAALNSIGLEERVIAIGSPIQSWQCSVGSHLATLPLPPGISISRESLDSELLSAAAAAGANVLQPCRSVITDSDDSHVTVQLDRGGHRERQVYDCVVVAAGLNAAGLSKRLPWVESPAGPFGVSFTANAAASCESGVIYMACDDDGYVGIVRLENGRVDVASALRSGSLAAELGSPQQRIERILSRSQFPDWALRNQSPLLTTPPLRRCRQAGRGRVLAIGDAAGYVEPFTGEGMTWAMQSGIVAADRIAACAAELSTVGDQWQQTHKSLLRSKRLVCRTVTTVLRSSVARRAVGRTLVSWPGLAKPLVRSLNSQAFRSHRLDASTQQCI